MSNVLVVGAGPTGLASALLLAEAGHEVTVIEATERLGGMAASINVSGQRVDLGSHRLHPSAAPEVMAFLERLLGDDLQIRTRNGRIGLAGRLVRFPLDPIDLARHLPPRFALAAARDAIVSPLRRPRADTYAEVVRAGLGPAVLDWFYGPYAIKLWGAPADELSGDIARRRISANGPVAIATKLAKSKLKGPATFLYPRLGYGQIIDSMVDRARNLGVTFSTSRRATCIDKSDMQVRVTLDDGAILDVDRVFWTAPPHHLAACVPGSPEMAQPRHRAMTLVFLTLETDQYTPFDAHYFPDPAILAARVSEPKNYRDGPDPSGQTVLCAEIACDVGDDIWTSDPATLGRRIADDLVAAGLPAASVTATHIERLPTVYPVVSPDEKAGRAALTAWSQSVPGVTVLGRQGLVVGDNLHHVLQMAMEATGCLGLDGRWDDARWARGLTRFESFVVED